MKRRNAPQHEDVTKDETLLACIRRAVSSLASVLAWGPELHGHVREMQQELITSQFLKTIVNT